MRRASDRCPATEPSDLGGPMGTNLGRLAQPCSIEIYRKIGIVIGRRCARTMNVPGLSSTQGRLLVL